MRRNLCSVSLSKKQIRHIWKHNTEKLLLKGHPFNRSLLFYGYPHLKPLKCLIRPKILNLDFLLVRLEVKCSAHNAMSFNTHRTLKFSITCKLKYKISISISLSHHFVNFVNTAFFLEIPLCHIENYDDLYLFEKTLPFYGHFAVKLQVASQKKFYCTSRYICRSKNDKIL